MCNQGEQAVTIVRTIVWHKLNAWAQNCVGLFTEKQKKKSSQIRAGVAYYSLGPFLSSLGKTAVELNVRLKRMQSKTFQLGSTAGCISPSSRWGPWGTQQRIRMKGETNWHFPKPGDYFELASHYWSPKKYKAPVLFQWLHSSWSLVAM